MRTAIVALMLTVPFQTKPVQSTPQAVEPLVGALEIDAVGVDSLEYPYLTSARPFAGWMFINGELRGKMPIKQRFLLSPGVYEVRAVVAARAPGGIQYWTVRWPRVVISQGSTYRLNTRQALLRFPYTTKVDETQEFHASLEPELAMKNVPLTEDRVDYFQKNAAREFQEKALAFLTGSPFKVVDAALQRIRSAPPSRPRIWIDMPSELGGPREFDVDQLRVLQEYLRPNIGGWGTAIPFIPNPLRPEVKQFLTGAMDELKKRNDAVAQQVAAAFDEIAAALEKARSR